METEADRALERQALAAVAQVVDDESDAEVLVVTSNRRVDGVLLDRAPSVRGVVTATSGTDHVDLEACRQRDVRVARCPLARRDAVVEGALAGLLWGLRRLGPQARAAVEGRWARSELPAWGPRLLCDATVGVVGTGVIGARVVERLAALGARVVATDPAGLPAGAEALAFDAMAQRCDAVTLHCHLVPATRGLVSESWLSRTRPDLVLVNTARGGLLDPQAALAALQSGRLGALAVDVFPEEPYPALAALAAHPDVLATPHAAGAHRGLAARVRAELVAAVGAWSRGEPVPHPVVVAGG